MKNMFRKITFVFKVHKSVPFLYRYLFKNKQVPLFKKFLTFAPLVLYVAIPTDIIVDVIPVLGLVDDFTIVAFILDNMKKQVAKHEKLAIGQATKKEVVRVKEA